LVVEASCAQNIQFLGALGMEGLQLSGQRHVAQLQLVLRGPSGGAILLTFLLHSGEAGLGGGQGSSGSVESGLYLLALGAGDMRGSLGRLGALAAHGGCVGGGGHVDSLQEGQGNGSILCLRRVDGRNLGDRASTGGIWRGSGWAYGCEEEG
jgi:hypothetical protein